MYVCSRNKYQDIKLAVNFITLLKSYKLLNHPVGSSLSDTAIQFVHTILFSL